MVFEESGERVVHLPKIASEWDILEKREPGSILMLFEKSGELAAKVGIRPCWLPNIVEMSLESTVMGGEVSRMSENDWSTGTLVSDALGGGLAPIGLVVLPDPLSGFLNVETSFQNQTVRSRSVADIDAELVKGFLATANAQQNEP